ncbi:MAG: zinc-ribbon domain-containing protein [Chitinispirillaceae bacterium]|nr:zinc-ribbon domain-containing protein [Chitinispirillaceae bacterium]
MAPDSVTCPHCGETIRRKAKACPHCGSDEATGWSDGVYLDGIDLPDEGAYEDALADEFGKGTTRRYQKIWIVVTACAILAVFIAGVVTIVR